MTNASIITVEEVYDYLTTTKNWDLSLPASKAEKYVIIRNSMKMYTSFLPETASLKQRGWHILHRDYSIQVCKHCKDSPVSFYKGEYRNYCSRKCGVSSPETRKKAVATMLNKFGTEYAIQSPLIKQRMKDNNVRKYGVENVFQVDEVKEKTINTRVEKYGVAHAMQNKTIRDKQHATMMEKYGDSFAVRTDHVKDNYKRLYGREHNRQSHISDENLTNLTDRDWLLDAHHTQKRTLTDIANELGVHKTTVSYTYTDNGIPKIRFPQSMAEMMMSNFLNDEGIEVMRGDRSIIAPYELDLYLPDFNLAIEINGIYWHSESAGKDRKYHKMKYDMCRSKGIRLLQIYDTEIASNFHMIKDKILTVLGKAKSRKIFARRTNILEVSTSEKQDFFTANHIQGGGPSSINYGLEYDGEIVAVMGFINRGDHFILNRYATRCNVPGGFTKLLTCFERKYNSPEIVTFADLRWSDGTLYHNSGFILDKHLPPDYQWTDGNRLWHKFNWRHGTGLKTLSNYDPNLSEYENMTNHKYSRIWDCGKLRFVKNKK